MNRSLALIAAAAALLLASAGTAVAADSSTITSPAGPVYAFHDFDAPPGTAFTVSGTASIAGNQGKLRCFAADGSSLGIAGTVDTSGGSFSAPVSADALGAELQLSPCRLRLVPSGDATFRPPDDTSDPFAGPLLAGSWYRPDTSPGELVTFELGASTLTAQFAFRASGDCGIEESAVVNTASWARSPGPFACAAAFAADAGASRSDVQIDGVDAYDPWHVQSDTPATPPSPASVTKSFDAATGLVTITTREPMFECASTGYPATDASCPTVHSAGVELDRTYATSSDGHVADVSDVWTSTDGRPHTLDVRVRDGMVADMGNGGAYELPGQSAFAAPVLNAVHSLPAGPGAILYKVDAQTPPGGDHSSPQGSISYSTAPDGPAVFTSVDPVHGTSELTLPYVRTIPAGGSFTLKMRYAEDFALAPVQAAAAAAVAEYVREAQTPPGGGGTPKPPGGTASPRLRVAGKVKVSGTTASIKLSCAGAPCPVAGALTTKVRVHRHRKTVTVARKSLTIPAGATATLKLSLNRKGKSLLAHAHKLATTLKVRSSGRTVVSAHATFKRKRRKR